MQNNKNQEMGEDCPLCKMTEEAVDNLKALDRTRCSSKVGYDGIEKKSSQKMTLVVLVLAVIIVGVVVYGLFSKPSEGLIEANLNDGLLPENVSADESPSSTLFIPEFTTTDIFGNQISLSDFRDEMSVLLVFWSTWCSSCEQEREDLNDFTLKHQDRIKVFAISSAETKSAVKKYFEEKDIEFTLLLDETRDIWNQYLVRGTPSHFLVNKNGEVLTVFPGLATYDNLETMARMLVDF